MVIKWSISVILFYLIALFVNMIFVKNAIEEHNYFQIKNKMSQNVKNRSRVYVTQHKHFLLLSTKQEIKYRETVYLICDL